MVLETSSQNLSVNSSDNNHISSLDGVRGFAVLLVVIFHLWVDFLPGGFLGVSLFFTLSGFVITSSLLRERDTTGRVRLRSFWARRARRLLPASLIVITVATIVWAVQGWMDRRIATEHIFALLQLHNWRIVIDDFSYFPNAVSHLWSLSLEMQFYVWAPLVIMISAKWKWSAALLFTLTIATGLVVTFLYNGHMNQVYGSAFTRWAEIATGCLVALFFNTKTIDAKYRHIINALGCILVLVIMYLSDTLGLFTTFYKNAGFVAISLVSATIIVACTQETIVKRLFSLSPLRYTGKISYGVYLFHAPLLMWVSRTSMSFIEKRLVVVVLTPVLAVLSYHYVETPIRRGALSWKVLTPAAVTLSACTIFICVSYL